MLPFLYLSLVLSCSYTASHAKDKAAIKLSDDTPYTLDELSQSIADKVISRSNLCTVENQGIRELTTEKVIPGICALSSDLFSLVDEINMNIIEKSCSISCTGTSAGDPFTTIFGSQISEPREDYISIQFPYCISDFDVSTSLIGTTTACIESSAVISTTGTAGDKSQIESKRYLRHRPGHEGFTFFSVAFTGDTTTASANSSQLIGIFDDEDGFAVGFDGDTFSVLHRRDSVDTLIAQSAFNVDKLDGAGPSGFTYDPTKLNMFRISYGWLGAATITFRIMTTDGTWVIFHVIERPGTAVGPSLIQPALPIRAEVIDNDGGNNLELRTACWNAGVVGSPNRSGHRYFSANATQTLMANDSETAMLTIRNKSMFESKTNKIEVRIAEFGGGAVENGDNVSIIRMRRDSELTGASYSDVSSGRSIMEVDTSATAFSGGDVIAILPVHARGNGPGLNFIPGSEFEIVLLPGETITITAENVVGNTKTIAHVAWEERF